MAIKEYPAGGAFSGVVGRTADESSPAWEAPVRVTEGAPNVVVIVLDGTGFGQLGCYGSPIATPNFDAIATGACPVARQKPGTVKLVEEMAL